MRAHERELERALRSVTEAYPEPPADLPEGVLHAVRLGDRRAGPLATLRLVQAQWPLIARGRLLPAVAAFVALVFGSAGMLMNELDLLVLTAALPVAAGLFVALLSGPGTDPAHEVVSITRTPFAALVLARTTVAMSVLVAVSLLASLILALLGGQSVPTLVAAWLGPTVVISAAATLVAQRVPRVLTVSLTLLAWAGVVTGLYLELNGVWTPSVSLLPLLRPGGTFIAVQCLIAVSLLSAAWLAVDRAGAQRVRL